MSGSKQERARKKERLQLILERDINKRPTFATKSMTMDYLSCGKLEGILLSISPWVAESGVDNRYWNGSRPMRADAVVSFEEDTSETTKTTEVGERSGVLLSSDRSTLSFLLFSFQQHQH